MRGETVRAVRDGGPWPIFRSTSDEPERAVSPLRAVATYWRKYAVFSGRASRSEFGYVWLINTIVFALVSIGLPRLLGDRPDFSLATGYLGPVLSPAWPLAASSGNGLADTSQGSGLLVHVILVVYSIVTLVPNLSVAFRRLHDVNLPGFLAVLGLGTGPFGVALLLLALVRSRPGGARFDRAVRRLPDQRSSGRGLLVGSVLAGTALCALAAVVAVSGATAVPHELRGRWQLVALRDEDGGAVKLPAGRILLTLTGSRLSGNDTCNDFAASVATVALWRTAALERNAVVCDDGETSARSRFNRDLRQVSRAERAGGDLELAGPGGILLRFAPAPAPAP